MFSRYDSRKNTILIYLTLFYKLTKKSQNRKLFDKPIPVCVSEVSQNSNKILLASRHISRGAILTRKAKGKSSNARPKLMPHDNHNDSTCIICKNYLSRLDTWRSNQ
jgi:hypothetical protein